VANAKNTASSPGQPPQSPPNSGGSPKVKVRLKRYDLVKELLRRFMLVGLLITAASAVLLLGGDVLGLRETDVITGLRNAWQWICVGAIALSVVYLASVILFAKWPDHVRELQQND
jgi:hypothetical protein